MSTTSPAEFLIAKARAAEARDPYEAKAWIIAAKSLFPNNFGIQFFNYLQEKNTEGHEEEAAECFSYIVMTFQNQPVELWQEISKLTAALRQPESGGIAKEQEFYLKMFQHISYEVQHKILLLTATHVENSLDHCRLILLLLKRFPQAISTHGPRLLENLVQGVSGNRQYREMLVNEALPMVLQKPPELSSHLLNRVLGIAIEYHVQEIYRREEDDKFALDSWRKMFEIMEICGRLLKWEKFISFNRNIGKDVYWQKLVQIVSGTRPSGDNKQVFYTAAMVFIYSIWDYVRNVRIKGSSDQGCAYILIESFRESNLVVAPSGSSSKTGREFGMDSVKITVTDTCNPETPNCLITAANCWQLLQSSELFQVEMNKLLLNLPIMEWVTRFIADLAVYLGQLDTASVIKTSPKDGLQKDVKLLSLAIYQNNLSVQNIGPIIVNILTELVQATDLKKGDFLNDFGISTSGRHLMLLPLTRRAILQFCVKVLVAKLNLKLNNPASEVSDTIIGYLLILLQLDWPNEMGLAQQIFNIITSRRSMLFLDFSKYVILVDFIEEFSYMWHPQGGEIHLEFTATPINIGQRRIGTRRADKGVKDDFKLILRQQIARCNEDMEALIIQFILQEQTHLFNELM